MELKNSRGKDAKLVDAIIQIEFVDVRMQAEFVEVRMQTGFVELKMKPKLLEVKIKADHLSFNFSVTLLISENRLDKFTTYFIQILL